MLQQIDSFQGYTYTITNISTLDKASLLKRKYLGSNGNSSLNQEFSDHFKLKVSKSDRSKIINGVCLWDFRNQDY